MIYRYQDIINTLNAGEFDFDSIAKEIFNYQRIYNPVYNEFLSHMGRNKEVSELYEVPFCPIAAFKYRYVITGDWEHGTDYFMSSGTGGNRSKHYIKDVGLYHRIAKSIFQSHFSKLSNYQVLSLLPHYSENPHSSLLSMVNSFISCSNYKGRSFLSDHKGLFECLNRNNHNEIPTILFAVSFALLDYVESYDHLLSENFIIIETGGMKKYKREMTKLEIFARLKQSFSGARICSEYGMTECFAQSYSVNSPWLKMNNYFRVIITDPMNPGHILQNGRTGRINIVDLANVHTLSFIATDDIGRISEECSDSFEVLGRLSNTDLRGCNYLI